jgi:hypothetical protein
MVILRYSCLKFRKTIENKRNLIGVGIFKQVKNIKPGSVRYHFKAEEI